MTTEQRYGSIAAAVFAVLVISLVVAARMLPQQPVAMLSAPPKAATTSKSQPRAPARPAKAATVNPRDGLAETPDVRSGGNGNGSGPSASTSMRIQIPGIGVDAPVIPVGLKDDGAMETPDFGLAGWYELGPRPGATGPAVIVAHVDSKRGPDVFYRLRELDPGDTIQVRQARGTKTFTVERSEQQLKEALPTKRIWNDAGEPVLRLITCGGDFDRSSGHYRSNVIVYAS